MVLVAEMGVMEDLFTDVDAKEAPAAILACDLLETDFEVGSVCELRDKEDAVVATRKTFDTLPREGGCGDP